jgi:hypothetical protein
LGATRTPKGTIIKKDKGITTKIFRITSLALSVVSMDIIHTIAPKFPTSNG